MSVSACSATANALMPGVLQTVIPRMPAALRSMLSVPVPHTETILSSGQAANTASLKRAWARILMRDLGVADAADQLHLLVGAALGEDAHRAQALRPLVRRAAVEDGGEVVGDDDHARGPANTAWAAATPAPASLR